jgi:DnaJ-class molecular chaperone
MKKKIKIMSSVLVASTFLFLAFGSEESKNKENSDSNVSNAPKSNDGTDTWIPDGYHRGSDCSDCSGTGHKTYYLSNDTPYSGICPSCNGRGYKTEKN